MVWVLVAKVGVAGAVVGTGTLVATTALVGAFVLAGSTVDNPAGTKVGGVAPEDCGDDEHPETRRQIIVTKRNAFLWFTLTLTTYSPLRSKNCKITKTLSPFRQEGFEMIPFIIKPSPFARRFRWKLETQNCQMRVSLTISGNLALSIKLDIYSCGTARDFHPTSPVIVTNMNLLTKSIIPERLIIDNLASHVSIRIIACNVPRNRGSLDCGFP